MVQRGVSQRERDEAVANINYKHALQQRGAISEFVADSGIDMIGAFAVRP